MSERVLAHLAALLACDTQNPPRAITAKHAIFAVLRDALPRDCNVTITDHGLGRVNCLARRGEPRLLFNVHLDTVPVGNGWTRDPLRATVEGDRVYGRGACDIKGAAAALLAVAETTDAPFAFLFSTDEEGASGCCVRRFCEALAPDAYEAVIVAEPTECRPVTAHRGYLSVIGRFTGTAGHSSEARALADNAIHAAARWAAAALASLEAGDEAGEGRSCFNIGRIEGGTKSNVIADAVDLRWSARLASGASNDAFFASLTRLPGGERATWERPFSGPPLPAAARDADAAEQFLAARGLGAGGRVDFWTEASLFSERGLPAIVLGPGAIAQAHAADEWVAIEQLARAERVYRALLEAA